MTKEQIEIYEYCKSDIIQIKNWLEKMPFKIQNHGCGSGVPKIEHTLEDIHTTMYGECYSAMHGAIEKIEEIIKKI